MTYLIWLVFLVLASYIAIKHTSVVDEQEESI